ncbi:MAG: rhomboid family intramembrane serine protease [Ignavibacteriales bacterium]|nr:rhomboid family intramembrane serine protease [Ignavibacteriales bacterium]
MPSYGNKGNFYRPSMFGGFEFFPPVIKWLMLTNAAVFVVLGLGGQLFTLGGLPLRYFFNYYLGLMPLNHGFYPWQLITYQFMHADFWHLLFNMLFGLWMFGMEVEHTWGSRKFLIYYLMCGVFAGVTQLLLAPILEPSSIVDQFGGAIPTIGASGAVYGVLLAFGMLFPDRYIFIYFLLPVKAKYFVAGLILIGVFSIGGAGNIANLAHLGGALAGYIFLLYDTRKFPFQHTVDRLQWWVNSKTTPSQNIGHEDVSEAKVFDINESTKNPEQQSAQMQIDEILDKISRGGYQSLTEEEKKILFEVSKKLN